MSIEAERYEVTLTLRVMRDVSDGDDHPRKWDWSSWIPEDAGLVSVDQVADEPCQVWDGEDWAEVLTTGFVITDKDTGQELATLPLTIGIAETIEGYEQAGYNVSWTWKRSHRLIEEVEA
jgi:hypothetical protein